MTPDVSVVVISYNDATRLTRAIRSVQRQTLRSLEIIVVDDASTDATADVVRRLAQDDSRIRYERLTENSGGCSAPRNRGVDLATAPWVMFCDSDDEYERHACKNLLETAERTGADVVCGTAERVDVRTGRVRRWRPDVHGSLRVADGLADLPELLYDTISVNKIYRSALLRDNGLRFPEGLLFEDQLFTLEAMAAAGRLAVIPQVVYRWYVDRLSEEPSITQRRNEARNVESRIEINRRIDAFLSTRGLDRIQQVKDLKFLRHDLYLYLSSMLEVDDETATVLMDRLAPYVEQVNLEPAWQVRPALRVAIYHLLLRDLEGVRSAMRFVKWASVVDVRIVERDGRQSWGCTHLDDGTPAAGVPAQAWLDVDELQLLGVPFTQRRYLHRLDSLSVQDGRVTASGSTVDYDGSLSDVEAIELRYLIGGDRPAVSVPAVWTGRDGIRRTWRADGPAADALLRPLQEKDRGTVGLALVRGEQVNVTSARSPQSEVGAPALRFPGRVRWTGPDTLELLPHDNGAVGWRAVRAGGLRARLASLREWWFRVPGATRLATITALVRRDALVPTVTWVGGRLPTRRLVVLEAEGGRAFDGNVRAVGDGLAGVRPDVRQAWIHRSNPALVPRGAEPVDRQSLRAAWLLSRAAVVVSDGTAAPLTPPGPRALVVNAGTGVPFHRLGLDDPSVLVSRAAVASVRRRARQWQLLLAPSQESASLLRGGFGYSGPTAEVGLPRIDGPAAARRQDLRGLRQRLDLPADRVIVVWAPASRPAGVPTELLDLERWAAVLGMRTYLLVRGLAGEGATVPTRLRSSVRDLAHEADVLPFLAAADLLVSDYSSVIGDAAALDLPVVLFQPDREEYVNRTRGLYPWADEVGPVVVDESSLLDEVGRLLDGPDDWDAVHGPRRRAWAARAAGPVDGSSTQRAVEALVSRLERR